MTSQENNYPYRYYILDDEAQRLAVKVYTSPHSLYAYKNQDWHSKKEEPRKTQNKRLVVGSLLSCQDDTQPYCVCPTAE